MSATGHQPDRHSAFGSDAFGRAAERLARFFGTPRYIIGQTLIVIVWICLNVTGVLLSWDPYPFILLNLAFSTQAAYAAPLILLAQTRQADRDKARERADADHREQIAAAHAQQLDALKDMAARMEDRLDLDTPGGMRVILDAVRGLGDDEQ